jgi:glucose uptake protein
MVSAAWGVFIWREFSSAPARAKSYLFWMVVLFLVGLTLVALAPLF